MMFMMMMMMLMMIDDDENDDENDDDDASYRWTPPKKNVTALAGATYFTVRTPQKTLQKKVDRLKQKLIGHFVLFWFF